MNDNVPPQNPSSTPAGDAAADSPPPKKKKKRRLWLWIPAALVVLLILLVLLLPTIAGTGMVRSMVVGKINDQLNGKLEIADWSFGWTSGARIDGVKLTDANGRQLLQLAHADVPVSLIGVLRGKYDLGKITVDGLVFSARREADGRLNFADLAKPSGSAPGEAPPAPVPSPAPAPSPSSSPQSSSPTRPAPQTKLPAITGEIVLTNCSGTIDDVQNKTTLHLASLEVDLKITDINQPIEDSLDAVVDNGRGQSGKFSAKGKALLVKNNVLLTDPVQILRQASVDQNVTVSGFDLNSLAPLLSPDGGINQLSGTTEATLGLHIAPDSAAALNAVLRVTNLNVGGSALKGDTLAAQTFEISAQHISFAVDKDAADISTARIVTGPADGSAPVTISLVQNGGAKSTVTLFADVSSQSLGQLNKNLPPQDSGTIAAGANIDFAHLASSLPHLFDLQSGLQLTSGNLVESLKISLTADRSTIDQSLKLDNLAGRNTKTQTDIALHPIELTAQTTNLGGGGALPDLRDLKLNLTSGFATVTANASSVDNLQAQVHATLQDAQHELSQIFDFGAAQLAGALDVSITSKGNLVPTGPVTETDRTGAFDVHGTLKDVHIIGVGSGPIDEPLVQFASTGQLHGSAQQTIDHLSNFDLTSQIGDAMNPTLDAHVTAEMTFGDVPKPVHNVSIKQCNLNLALAQQQFGALIPALAHVHTSAGTLIVGGFASGQGAKTRLVFNIELGSLDMQQIGAGASAAPVPLLSGYSLKAALDATATSDSSGSSLDLTKLQVTDNQNLVAVNKTDGQFHLTTGSGDKVETLDLADMIQKAEASVSFPQLSKLSALANALSAPPKTADKTASPLTITAGSATLTLDASHKQGQLVIVPQLNVSPDLAIQNGSSSQTIGPVDFTANVALIAEAQKISKVDISQFTAHGFGATISLKGAVDGLSDRRELHDVSADLTYDAAPLWKAVLPFLSPSTQEQFKDAVVSGKFTKHFVVSGSYPAGVPFNEAMKNLSASGGVSLGAFKGHGVDLQNLEVPIFLKNGKLVIANSDKPNDYAAPASLNGGQLSLAGISVDLADPHMILNMDANSQLMKNVGLNPAISDVLGQDAGNILFEKTSDSTGLLGVIVNKCQNVPLDDTLKKNVPSNTGQLLMNVTIQDLTLSGGQLGGVLDKVAPLLQLAGKASIAPTNIKGSVKDYKITLAHGTMNHDMTITLGQAEHTIRLYGGVDMLTEKLKGMTLVLPLSLFGGNDSDLPNGLNIVFSGTLTSPKPDVKDAVKKSLLGGGGNNPLNNLNNLLGGKKSN